MNTEVEGIWTIGHSTRTADEFLTLLHSCAINSLVDVRSFPGSRRCPQFGREVMPAWLADDGIAYRHMSDLGGRRNKQYGVDPAINAAWKNASFKNYADYTLSDAFEAALSDLIAMAPSLRVVYMCSEAVPWKCHRLIISNSLVARGLNVHHIMSASKVTEHRLGQWGPEPVIANSRVSYPVPKSEKQRQRARDK
jgi:uncharacterized protein (DUF488 family)